MLKTTLTLTAPIFFPELPGSFRQFYHYAPGLLERGVEMKVFTLTDDTEGKSDEWINGIRVFREDLHHPVHYMERERLLQPALRAAFAQLKEKPQVISPLGNNWQMVRQLKGARKRGVGVTCYLPTAPEFPADRWSAFKQRIATHLQLRAFDKVILCSSAQVEIYRKAFRLPSSKMVTIPNGVRADRFRPAADEAERLLLRQKLGLQQDEVIFAYVGNIVERKGVDFLVRAWREVQRQQPKARLLLIGQRTMPKTFRDSALQEEHRQFERRLAVALESLHPEALPVLFQPPVERVEDWLRASDAFLFPSYCEGLPNALIEAMACGLPAVTAPFAGLPLDGLELGRRGQEFLLVPHDEHEWTRTICELASNETRRQTLGNAAQAWIHRVHRFSNVLDQWAEHYHTVSRIHFKAA